MPFDFYLIKAASFWLVLICGLWTVEDLDIAPVPASSFMHPVVGGNPFVQPSMQLNPLSSVVHDNSALPSGYRPSPFVDDTARQNRVVQIGVDDHGNPIYAQLPMSLS